MLFFAKKALLAKIETTYGTDAAPTGSSNAMLVSNLSITPIEAELAKRELALPFFGHFGAVPAGASVKVSFAFELAGSGTAGTAPAWGPIARACGHSETINAGVDVTYAPVSSSFESATLYFALDGVRHILTGCRGKLSLSCPHNGIPRANVEMTGIYNAPTDAALPTLTLTAWQKPLPVNKVNTTFSLHSVSAVLQSLELDTGVNVVFRDYVNAAQEVRITNREASATAKIEAKTIATKDWFTVSRDATTGTLQLVHGTASGNKVQIDCPSVQIGNPSYEDADGITLLNLPLLLRASSGNDEYTIKAL